MKSNIVPKLPPSLRPRPKGPDISEGFAPIVAAVKPAPPVPPAVAPPVPETPASPSPALKKPFTPKPTPPNARVPVLEGRIAMFAGTFQPDGSDPFEMQTPLTGRPAEDRQSLINAARKLFPTGGLKLKSTRIFTKELGTPEVFPKGTTLGGLFGEAGSPTENTIEAGEVFFQGERCSVMLRNLRARSAVTVALRPPGGNAIAFSNQVASNTLAATLASVVKEILGRDARELKITLQFER